MLFSKLKLDRTLFLVCFGGDSDDIDDGLRTQTTIQQGVRHHVHVLHRLPSRAHHDYGRR